MKTILLTISLVLMMSSHMVLAALFVDNPNSATKTYTSDVPGTGARYEVYRYTFDIYQPINIRYFTPSFADLSYQNAAVALIAAINQATTPPVNLQFQISPITNLEQPYDNTVIFYEMDTGEGYLGAAIGFNDAPQPCAEIINLAIDPTYSFFTAIELGAGTLSRNCDNQVIDTGLVVFNTNTWNELFKPHGERDPLQNRTDLIYDAVAARWTPPFAEQQYLIMHEFTHLLGLEHIRSANNANIICSSVMVPNIADANCNATPAPTVFSADDLDLLDQLY